MKWILGDKLNKCKRGLIITQISESRNGKLGVSEIRIIKPSDRPTHPGFQWVFSIFMFQSPLQRSTVDSSTAFLSSGVRNQDYGKLKGLIYGSFWKSKH